DQRIKIECGIDRKIEDGDSPCFQRLSVECIVLLPENFAPVQEPDPREYSDQNPAGIPDPFIVEGVFQKIKSAENYCQNPDLQQPVAPMTASSSGRVCSG